MRTIFHLDLDSFFVSAERLKNPSLRGIPVAVGGVGARGVISSCSYEARKLGVRSAMPTAKALKLCPQLRLCDGDYALYVKLSKQVFSLLDLFTPVHESVSIDEAYLDMTGTESLHGPPLAAAAKLRARILDETGLTASIGIASNRLVAKVATDACKPDNMLHVLPKTEAQFLAPMGVEKLPGCGKVTHAWLKERGIQKISELQRYPKDVLESNLGKFGLYLHEAAWGRGSIEFHEESKTRSISKERTFKQDIECREALHQHLWEMSSQLGKSLREDNVFAKAIRLKLRYPPFETVTRSRVLNSPTQQDLLLNQAFVELFEDHWDNGRGLRLLGIGCVIGDKPSQLSLFDPSPSEKQNTAIDQIKDRIQSRFGNKALRRAKDLLADNE